MAYTKDQMIDWCVRNPKSIMIAAAKRRARVKELPFDLSPEDFEIPEFCPVFGIRLERNTRGDKRACDNSPSLDRIQPWFGYVKGNVRVISWRANKLRCDATPKELEMLLEDARKLQS
jgi:hypothetical protein